MATTQLLCQGPQALQAAGKSAAGLAHGSFCTLCTAKVVCSAFSLDITCCELNAIVGPVYSDITGNPALMSLKIARRMLLAERSWLKAAHKLSDEHWHAQCLSAQIAARELL